MCPGITTLTSTEAPCSATVTTLEAPQRALPTPRFPNRGIALSGQDTEGPRLCQGLLTQTVACVPVSTQFSLGFGWEVTRVLFFNVICQLIRIILEIIEKRERHKIHIRKLKIPSRYILPGLSFPEHHFLP